MPAKGNTADRPSASGAGEGRRGSRRVALPTLIAGQVRLYPSAGTEVVTDAACSARDHEAAAVLSMAHWWGADPTGPVIFNYIYIVDMDS